MTDITTTNLDLAIIDQIVAGSFAGRTYAFTTAANDKGQHILAVAVANELGYHPIDGKTTRNLIEAERWAEGLNEHIGLSEESALSIVISTMGGRRARAV